MDDTENYFNTILQKRANAVSNPYASQSKNNSNYNNITRTPVVQEKQ
jgi:hypothetical protein